MSKEILGYNTDKDNCSRCIKANYYKMGLANYLYHPDDGYAATCVIEFDLEEMKEKRRYVRRKDKSKGNS